LTNSRLKSIDSSHMPLSSQVKSMWSSRRWITWGHFSL